MHRNNANESNSLVIFPIFCIQKTLLPLSGLCAYCQVSGATILWEDLVLPHSSPISLVEVSHRVAGPVHGNIASLTRVLPLKPCSIGPQKHKAVCGPSVVECINPVPLSSEF